MLSRSSTSHSFTALNAHIAVLDAQQTLQAVTNIEKAAAADSASNGDKKRKAVSQDSKGVGKLKKANIKGMSKISSFFAPPGKKKEVN